MPAIRALLTALLTSVLTVGLIVATSSASAATEVKAPQVFGGLDTIEGGPVVKGRKVRFDVNAWNSPLGTTDPVFDFQVGRSGMRRATPPTWSPLPSLTGDAQGVARVRMRVGPGQALCLRARAHIDGQTGPWSSRECVVRPLDDRQVRRAGPMQTVRTRPFVDHRATVLRPTGRMLLVRVPAKATIGAVFLDDGGLNDGNSWPTLGLLGSRGDASYFGNVDGSLVAGMLKVRHGGTMVVRTEPQRSMPIGGLFVLPRWADRR